MSLVWFRVTNVTEGRLELRPYKIVLGPRESVKLAAPIAEDVHWLVGRRLVKITPVTETLVQPFQLAEPSRPRVDKPRGRRTSETETA